MKPIPLTVQPASLRRYLLRSGLFAAAMLIALVQQLWLAAAGFGFLSVMSGVASWLAYSRRRRAGGHSDP